MKSILTCLLFVFLYDDIQALNPEKYLDELTIGQIDSIDFGLYDVSDLEKLIEYCIILTEDSVETKSFKGMVALGGIAQFLDTGIRSKTISYHSFVVKRIIKKLKKQNYHIYSPPPSDFRKLLHYICQDKYSYIYMKFRGSIFYCPVVFIASSILISCFIVFYRLKRKTDLKPQIKIYMKYYLWGCALVFILSIVAFLNIKFFCCGEV